jgi:hypothetical protein
MTNIFPILIMNARPGAGKSEIIHFLAQVPLDERNERFHIGPMHVLDDFPLLWTWFEEDDLLEHVFRRPRLHTDPEGYFLHDDLWHLLIRRLGLDYEKWKRDNSNDCTVLIEFSRGAKAGGYRTAYEHLTDGILSQAACMYVKVSYEESLRKNRKRFNAERPDSILEHALPDGKMERLYREDDWAEFSEANPEYLTIRDIKIPYVVFENQDDITTKGGQALEERLEVVLGRLWQLWQQR